MYVCAWKCAASMLSCSPALLLSCVVAARSICCPLLKMRCAESGGSVGVLCILENRIVAVVVVLVDETRCCRWKLRTGARAIFRALRKEA